MDDQDQIILSIYPHTDIFVTEKGVELLLPGGDQHSPVVKEITFPNCIVTFFSAEDGRLERVFVSSIKTVEDVVDEIPPL